MKEHRLYRRYGKRQWTIGMYDTFEAANEAAVENVKKCGHMYPLGTTFGVETMRFLGFVNNGELSKVSGFELP